MSHDTPQTQTQTPAEAREKLRQQFRNKGNSKPFQASRKVGSDNSLMDKSILGKVTSSFFKRRRLLVVPDAIREAHPDKHFCFVNRAKVERQGGFHENGYQIFINDDVDPDALTKEKFFQARDGTVQRNEMVLAYIDKDEYEYRKAEREIARGQRDVMDVIKNRPELVDCFPIGTEEKEYLIAKAKV